MQRVRVVFVCMLSGASEPPYTFTQIWLLTQLATEEHHSELVHRSSVAQCGCFTIEQDRTIRFLPGPSSELVTHGSSVRRSGMVLLGRLHVQLVCFFVVDGEA